MINSVKITGKTADTLTVAGWGVVFGGYDLSGETFTKDTDFSLDMVPNKPVFYDHTLEDVQNMLGVVKSVKLEEGIGDISGLWIEAQLERARAYVDEIERLVVEGVLGWSSGSVGHLVRYDGSLIKSWPIVEFSLTPTPCEPRTLGVERIRSLAKDNPIFNKFIPAVPTGKAEAVGDTALSNGQAVNLKPIHRKIWRIP